MCVLSIKVSIWKKSGNLFNDPHIYIYIFNPWKIVCNLGFHEVFFAKQQSMTWKSKIQKYTDCIFSVFLIFNSLHLLNCLMIVILQKTSWNPGFQNIFHGLYIYIYLFIIIYIYIYIYRQSMSACRVEYIVIGVAHIYAYAHTWMCVCVCV